MTSRPPLSATIWSQNRAAILTACKTITALRPCSWHMRWTSARTSTAWAMSSALIGSSSSSVPACATCHGKQGAGSNTLPRIAGQHAAYLETQMKLFSKRERTNDNAIMHTVVEKMTPLEMAAVSEYLSGK